MENKVAETESPVVVESKVEELKRKSMDSKVTNDHDNQNGNDEPITKKVKTAENDDNSDDVDTLHGTNGNKNGNVDEDDDEEDDENDDDDEDKEDDVSEENDRDESND